MLAGDACSRPFITIISHDLHAGDIRRAMGEIISYHERDLFSPFFWFLRVVHPLAFLFCFLCDGSSHRSFIRFLWKVLYNNLLVILES